MIAAGCILDCGAMACLMFIALYYCAFCGFLMSYMTGAETTGMVPTIRPLLVQMALDNLPVASLAAAGGLGAIALVLLMQLSCSFYSPNALCVIILIIILCILQFVSSRGNEYFCEIDEDYLTDRFNLTGLNTEVSYYQYALDLVTDVFDLDADDDLREQIEKSARHLYGLVHARYIVTTRGLAKMLEKYKKSEFGKCPRVMCDGHALLPVGESDLPNISTVKLYCPKCEDIYNPKSTRHSSIDGAYFGTSFHSILFQVYPALNPEKSSRRYEPRIYGFKVHAAAALARYQDNQREDLKWRLAEVDIKHRFIEDSESEEDAIEYDEA
ncbi:Casein kinase II regulatory subunit alpha-helical [Penicillium bovifimosum]|uniref:Casein kinase II subunit beta n=1 Tax=Penicillium bovifimosum TaxID=126998 RepID=A0A9W9L3Z9_9EURO|nr:Casein kinase II regulatory subunit alpha-helical [Penicillium bovifimosum]KAJ5135828.1 Casein kinase II regulatory subunit alpha-helical [Penicillium bovifimosum]